MRVSHASVLIVHCGVSITNVLVFRDLAGLCELEKVVGRRDQVQEASSSKPAICSLSLADRLKHPTSEAPPQTHHASPPLTTPCFSVCFFHNADSDQGTLYMITRVQHSIRRRF